MIKIELPNDIDKLTELRIGQKVLLSGTIYTARDAAHKRIIETIEKGNKSPFPIQDSAIYYVGPSPTKPGDVIGSAGPTTSYRMDPFTPFLLERGLKIMIGKGQRSAEVVKSMKENSAVYLVAIGGAAVVISQAIIKSEVIAYDDLGAEAVRKIKVENFPCIVAIDTFGKNLFKK